MLDVIPLAPLTGVVRTAAAGEGFKTLREILFVLVSVAEVPITEIPNDPIFAAVKPEIVKETGVPLVTAVAGLNVAIAPLGKFAIEKVTVSPNELYVL